MRVELPNYAMQKRKTKTSNILSLLFFSIGAVHIYSKIQQQSSSSENTTTWGMNNYYTIGLIAALVAGLIELATMVEF